ncbi:MAG: DHH family phosphoesterase, partial [Planctomycetota bacterium]|nr:DHH family phosphoesterase [Planctomycetota bacterium]
MASDDIISLLGKNPASRLALSGHSRPDGDSLGACFALAEILRSLGHAALVVNPGPISGKLSFLTRPEWIANPGHPGWWRDFDLFGVLDCGEIDRLPEINREAAAKLPAFNLDHHASSAGLGQAVWIDPAASSTCELVVRLARTAGWDIPPGAAQALWTGIVSDTGRFSQENATPAALEAARLCLLAGAKPVLTDIHLFQSA